jgi:ATP-dependent Clp protease ATP-binding subunit ClpC
LEYAQHEALVRDHSIIDPAHLLAGMFRERKGIASEALRNLQISEAALGSHLDSNAAEFKQGAIEEIGLSDRSKNVLEMAVAEWRELGHEQIGTAHMLLGLCREEKASGAGALQGLGMDPDRVRDEVLRLVETRGPERSRRSKPKSGA